MLTSCHYTVIARGLRKGRPADSSTRKPGEPGDSELALMMVAWSACCVAIAAELAADNPNFNKGRFLFECLGDAPCKAKPI